MSVIIRLTSREERRALPILLRHSPGAVLPDRTYILRPEAVDDAMLARIVAFEDELLARGEAHFYAVLATRAKRGLRGAVADARYFFEPKLRRVGREIRAFASRRGTRARP